MYYIGESSVREKSASELGWVIFGSGEGAA